jgi:UrcA family protein
MQRNCLIAGAALLLLPVATMAHGAHVAPPVNENELIVTGDFGQEVRTMRVSVADLDLRTDHAVQRAGYRIRYAAKIVCDKDGTRELYQLGDYRQCYTGAYDGAHDQLSARVAVVRAS